MKNMVETSMWSAKIKLFTIWLFTGKGDQILTRVVSNIGTCSTLLLRDQNGVFRCVLVCHGDKFPNPIVSHLPWWWGNAYILYIFSKGKNIYVFFEKKKSKHWNLYFKALLTSILFMCAKNASESRKEITYKLLKSFSIAQLGHTRCVHLVQLSPWDCFYLDNWALTLYANFLLPYGNLGNQYPSLSLWLRLF